MPPFDVVTFGETMIRLSPPGFGRLESTDLLDLRIGGSESNTAIALVRLERTVAWWSKLPSNPLGRRVAASIRARGVDVSHVLWSDAGRVGLYFIEFGVPPRPHHVYYDRADSAASTLRPDEVDWSHLDGARHLHLTGITCALAPGCLATVDRAIQEAKGRGMTVSLDVNYRSKLWPPERARETLQELLPRVDLAVCPVGDASTVFGLEADGSGTARVLQSRYHVPRVVVTAGAEGAFAVDGDREYHAEAISAQEIDRVGGGDAFAAGVLDGFLDGDLERGLRYGVAMAALKRTLQGDELIATREEIEAVVAGAASGIHR